MRPRSVPRHHSLDALRAAMMLLGLVLHSAASYTQSPLRQSWPFQDSHTSVVFDLLILFIHLFRMPVFFLVSGFFAALLYHRDGAAGFAGNRARRVLLPLVLFWGPMFALVGFGFIFAARQAGGPMPWEVVPDQAFLRQPILGHLWFLYDLLIFYVAALVALPLAARLPEALRRRVGVLFAAIAMTGWGAIAMAGVTTLTLVPMNAPGIETSAALLPPFPILLAYGVFFAFGWLLYGARVAIDSYGARWKAWLAAGICASIGYLVVLIAQPIADPPLQHLLAVAFAGLSIWLLIFGLVGVFVRHMNRPRPLVRYFSDASYWMYLVHLAPAIWIPGLLARSNAPAFVKFAVVLGLTTFITTATYHFLVRSTAIGVFLNGRRYPRSLPAQTSDQSEPRGGLRDDLVRPDARESV